MKLGAIIIALVVVIIGLLLLTQHKDFNRGRVNDRSRNDTWHMPLPGIKFKISPKEIMRKKPDGTIEQEI